MKCDVATRKELNAVVVLSRGTTIHHEVVATLIRYGLENLLSAV